jgi:hypothetical protein
MTPKQKQARRLPASRRGSIHTAKRMTMQTPAGVKKYGVHTAFSPRRPLRRTVHTFFKLYNQQRRQIRGIVRRQDLHAEFLDNIISRFARMQQNMYAIKKRTDAQILSATRAALAAVEKYAEYLSQKKVDDIKVAVFDRDSFTEAKLKDLETHYWSIAVGTMAEDYVDAPAKFQKLMSTGIIDDGLFEEIGYVTPAVILERFKNLYNGRVYNMLEPKEKKFMKESFDFFLARTPLNVYELRDDAPIPAWYLKDLYAAMNAYAGNKRAGR